MGNKKTKHPEHDASMYERFRSPDDEAVQQSAARRAAAPRHEREDIGRCPVCQRLMPLDWIDPVHDLCHARASAAKAGESLCAEAKPLRTRPHYHSNILT